MAVTRKQFFPYTVTIDDQPVRLRLKRMSPPEFEEFRAMFVSLGQSRGAPASMAALVAQNTAREAKAGDEAPLDPIDEAVTLDDLKVEAAYLRANAEWQQDVFDAYVSVAPGDVFDEDEDGQRVEVTNGRQFAELYHGQGVIAKILAELYLANVLTSEQKKTLQSRSASGTGSTTEPSQGTPGAPPVPTAAPAASSGSVAAEAATAPLNDTSSGTTVPLSSESAPCCP